LRILEMMGDAQAEAAVELRLRRDKCNG